MRNDVDTRCMEPVSSNSVVCGEEFIHQIKWDGIRGVSVIADGRVSVYTRNGIECSASYPELKSLPDCFNTHQAVLDGELVVFADGKPSFYHALRRHRTKSVSSVPRIAAQYPVRYIVFDLLYLNGADIRMRPLEERQQQLETRFLNTPVAAKADSFDDGEALFSLMKQKKHGRHCLKTPAQRLYSRQKAQRLVQDKDQRKDALCRDRHT